MKRISLVLALFATVPLVSTACSKDDESNGGDGDGDAGDGDGDTGGTNGDGDGDTGGTNGDGDTGGTNGDGDGDTGGTNGDGDATGGMGGFGGDAMGGMGGGGSDDFASLCTDVCAVTVAEGCPGASMQGACETACAMQMVDGCESEALARITCEATLDASGWECNPNIGGFLPWYTSTGDTACGATLEAYNTCVD